MKKEIPKKFKIIFKWNKMEKVSMEYYLCLCNNKRTNITNLKFKFMKKLFGLLTLAVCTMLFLASCGGAKDATKELDVSSAEVLGDSADIVSVVDGKYTLVGKVTTDITQSLSIKIKLKLEKPISEKDIEIGYGWQVEILDKNGTSLIDDLALKTEEISKLKKFMTESEEGAEEEFTFEYNLGNGDLYSKIMEEANGLALNGVTYRKTDNGYIGASDESTEEETTNDEDAEATDVSSGDFDEVLDAYSEYVDKYIAYCKKAAKGDMSALSEYPELMQKAQEFGEKLQNAQGDATPEQWAKYMKIQAKFIKAVQEMK